MTEGEKPGRNSMPLVQVTMLTGRSADQKRKLAARITDAMVEEAGARREAEEAAPDFVYRQHSANPPRLPVPVR